MPKIISDLTKQSIKKAIRAGDRTLEKIAEQYQVSIGTVRRLAKEMPEREAVRVVQQQAIAQHLTTTIAGAPFDMNAILITAINDLAAEMPKTSGKSKEGVGAAIGRLSDLLRKYNPQTERELALLAIAIPNFDPQVFAKELRALIEQRAVG